MPDHVFARRFQGGKTLQDQGNPSYQDVSDSPLIVDFSVIFNDVVNVTGAMYDTVYVHMICKD